MDAFTTHTGTAVALRRGDVDTDQIIPSEYLKRVTRTGFADGLFKTWRGSPGFALDDPRHEGATVLVAGPDFGTGSSREHAVWALQDGGFRVVLSSRFADIFRGNAGKNGLLAAQAARGDVDRLSDLVEADPDAQVTVDLESRTVTTRRSDGGAELSFAVEVDDHTRWRLLNGYDDIALSLRHEADIDAYEAARPAWKPSTAGVATG